MIRVRLDTPLADQVKAIAPTWERKARTRRTRCREAGAFVDKPAPHWSDAKPVFMRLQHSKCAYCERELGHGAIEHDLEHFRPKSSSAPWNTESEQAIRTGRVGGYWWLAYDLGNYAASCKTCNSPLKGNRFPIAGEPGAPEQPSAELDHHERPFLLFPLGERDVDPAEVFTFEGVLMLPRSDASPWLRNRAAVTIAFFQLNREDLQKERARAVTAVFHAYRLWVDSPTMLSRTALQQTLSRTADHTACRRAFYAVLRRDPDHAAALYETAVDWLRQYIDDADADFDFEPPGAISDQG